VWPPQDDSYFTTSTWSKSGRGGAPLRSPDGRIVESTLHLPFRFLANLRTIEKRDSSRSPERERGYDGEEGKYEGNNGFYSPVKSRNLYDEGRFEEGRINNGDQRFQGDEEFAYPYNDPQSSSSPQYSPIKPSHNNLENTPSFALHSHKYDSPEELERNYRKKIEQENQRKILENQVRDKRLRLALEEKKRKEEDDRELRNIQDFNRRNGVNINDVARGYYPVKVDRKNLSVSIGSDEEFITPNGKGKKLKSPRRDEDELPSSIPPLHHLDPTTPSQKQSNNKNNNIHYNPITVDT